MSLDAQRATGGAAEAQATAEVGEAGNAEQASEVVVEGDDHATFVTCASQHQVGITGGGEPDLADVNTVVAEVAEVGGCKPR